jgi:hypothetical protein
LMNFVKMSNDAKNMRQKENMLAEKQLNWLPFIDILNAFLMDFIL